MPKCKVCKEVYIKSRPLQTVCSPICALQLAQIKRERDARKDAAQDRKSTREALAKHKTRNDYIREAQKEVNRFVRLRDRLAGVTCICCSRPLTWDKPNSVDAGHYRSTGSAPHMRFDTFGNISAQLVHCNRWKGGRSLEQVSRIRKRYGQVVLDAIDSDQCSRKWTIDELVEIAHGFRQWANELAKKDPASNL
jgi:hypothetical protein